MKKRTETDKMEKGIRMALKGAFHIAWIARVICRQMIAVLAITGIMFFMPEIYQVFNLETWGQDQITIWKSIFPVIPCVYCFCVVVKGCLPYSFRHACISLLYVILAAAAIYVCWFYFQAFDSLFIVSMGLSIGLFFLDEPVELVVSKSEGGQKLYAVRKREKAGVFTDDI